MERFSKDSVTEAPAPHWQPPRMSFYERKLDTACVPSEALDTRHRPEPNRGKSVKHTVQKYGNPPPQWVTSLSIVSTGVLDIKLGRY